MLIIIMKLCSACLLGFKCRYDGKDNLKKSSRRIMDEYYKHEIIEICPEYLGGLPIPRSGSRIVYGDGKSVLDGKSKVITDNDEDVTKHFIKGAFETLKLVKYFNVNEVIMKQGSPSCGHGFTQGGLKKRGKTRGNGVTAALLDKNNIKIFTEEDYI